MRTIPVPVYLLFIAAVVIGAGLIARRRGSSAATAAVEGTGLRPGAGIQYPEYQRDHQIQERWYVHAFLAYYTGDGGDPAYSLNRQENLDHLAGNWGLPDAAALARLVHSYEQGECTPAFDLIRVIKLMRHGYGAGLVSDADSWRHAVAAAQRLYSHYATWDDVYQDFQAGREMWWRSAKGRPAPAGELQTYAERYAEARQFVIQGRPLR